MNALFALALLQQETSTGVSPLGAVMGTGMMICWLVIVLLMVIGMWMVFVKAGKPGWAAIIPIYNIIVALEIAGKPIWWFILLLIPFVGFIMWLIVVIAVARNFGKGVGFAIGLWLLPFIFFPILGFGDAKYQPVAA
jgi:Family of unknown function (DUF5684)